MKIPFYSENPYFHRNNIYAVLLHPDNTRRQFFLLPIKGKVEIGGGLYDIDPNVMQLTGRFRVPTYFYHVGIKTPIDLRNIPKFAEQGSAESNKQGYRSHALSELLLAFAPNNMPLLLALAGIGVTLLATAIIYFTIGTKVNELHEFIIPTPTPVGTPSILGNLPDAP